MNDAITDVHRAIGEGRVPVPTGRGGHPSLTGEGTHSARVSFRVPEESREHAKAVSREEFAAVSRGMPRMDDRKYRADMDQHVNDDLYDPYDRAYGRGQFTENGK